jgi:hypothetical protein
MDGLEFQGADLFFEFSIFLLSSGYSLYDEKAGLNFLSTPQFICHYCLFYSGAEAIDHYIAD